MDAHTILMNSNRHIYGAEFLEEHLQNRELPGIPPYRGANYLPVDTALNCRVYKSDDDGWIHHPSQRVMKRRVRAAEKRKDRQGWLGTASGSLKEPEEPSHLPAL